MKHPYSTIIPAHAGNHAAASRITGKWIPAYAGMTGMKWRDAQSGNALFLILIAVALFAALSYAVTQSSRGSGGIDREQTALQAAQIVQFSTDVALAVQRMQIIGGTKEDALEWQTDVFETLGGNKQFASGINSNDRPNVDNVFAPQGGSISPITFEKSADFANVSSGALVPGHSNLLQFSVLNIGTNAADLVMVIERLKENICVEINKRLGIENPSSKPPSDDFAMHHFGGIYTSSPGIADTAEIVGKQSFCINDTYYATPDRPNNYFYIHVLIPR